MSAGRAEERPPAVLLEGVGAAYDGHVALEDVSLSVPRGFFAAVVGPNGAGKSTLLRVLLGLLPPTAGRVEVLGRPPARARGSVGYVPQHVSFPKGLPVSVLDAVLMGRYAGLGPGRRPGEEDRELALAALEQVGLAGDVARRFQDLSGGQQRRALIARALAAGPALLLLDEPTAGLDSGARARFYALVCDLQRTRGLSLVCATHDLDVVGEHADTLVLLDGTVRAEGRPSDVLASGALPRAYRPPVGHVHEGREFER